jgi:hypothetical protein
MSRFSSSSIESEMVVRDAHSERLKSYFTVLVEPAGSAAPNRLG